MFKINFTQRAKDLYYMKKQLRKEQQEISKNQKIQKLLDNEHPRSDYGLKNNIIPLFA